MKSCTRLPFMLLVLLLTLPKSECGAQSFCTFSGRDVNNGLEVKIDDINIHNLIKNKDTTIFNSSFRFDWPAGTGVSMVPHSPVEFYLSPNYPNSFTTSTLFSTILPECTSLRLTVHNILGQEVTALEKKLPSGFHEFSFLPGDLPQGVYFLSAATDQAVKQIKLVKLSAATTGRPELLYRGFSPTASGQLEKSNLTNSYTFTGYAKGYLPSTLANIVPIDKQNYIFEFVPFTSLGISTGGFSEAGSENIPSTGGTMVINKPSCPVNGMTIEVAPGSYSEPRTFSVTWAPVLDSGLGEDFTPVSPLIRIDNGGGSSDSAMVLTIPIHLERDQFAMAFFYDEMNNELEALPLINLTNDEITAATRHFSDGEQALRKGAAPMNYIHLIVGAVRSGRLSGNITTKFTPGVDDWEFTNYGSFVAFGGHCGGQSLAMMWYFTARKPRLGQLFNQYDEVHTKDMWMDNPRGYKFCSVLHKDRDFDAQLKWLDKFETAAKAKFPEDSLHYLSFAYAMKIAGKPQYVRVANQASAHALVAFGVNNGEIKICDPNYPGEIRTIKMVNGQFLPYESKIHGTAPVAAYPKIRYIAKSSMISFAGIEKRWSEFEAGTIGTVPPNAFPETAIYYLQDGEKIAVPDEMTVMADSLEMFAECPACPIKYPANRTPLDILQENGTYIARITNNVKATVNFKPFPGTRRYGFCVSGFTSYIAANFIDFRWVTITKQPLLFIKPEKPSAAADQEITFIARHNGAAPSPCTWVWDFGDATDEVRVTDDSTVKHIYGEEGQFAVKVRLLDKNNAEVARATVTAVIGNPLVGLWAFDVTVTDDICDLTFDREVFPMICTVENNKLCFSMFDLPPNCFNFTIENNHFSWWGTSVDDEGLTRTITASGTIVDQDHWYGTGNEIYQLKDDLGNIKTCTYNTIFTAVRR